MAEREGLIERLTLITKIDDKLVQTLHYISKEIGNYQS
jgi:hypothetical protein